MKCGQVVGLLVTETCDCGHLVGMHRRTPDTKEIVCDRCQTSEEPIDRELARRLDGMVDMILRMEQRLTTVITS